MRKPRHPARAILCALAAALTLRAADAAQFGALVGLVRDATGAPVAEATVTAVRTDGSATRATLTGSDGLYSFADLPPGAWSVSVELVDHRSVSRAALAVLAGQATRADLAVAAPAGAQLAAAPAPAAAPVRAAPQLPEALQAPEPGPAVDTQTPFAVGDLGWMNGTGRGTTPVFDTKFFTPEVRFDVNYLQDFNHPVDDTIVGSSEVFRSGEFQVDAAGPRRRLPLPQRAGALHDAVRHVLP